ncbi:MAG: cytosolic protein, partial [Synechococcales bacterium]|nr:cytosolic protein [Synechococcales bacterium]
MPTIRVDEDSPWKLLLRQYFREAIEFFFPTIAHLIAWSKPIEFLDKEFQKITPDAEIGKRFADQLVKVQRKRGKALILLIHLEIQAVPEKNFPERMFIYAIRIFELFHQEPVSLAILCDGK